MLGIDRIFVVTGKDWRAVELGAYAYAAQVGHYIALSRRRVGSDQSLLREIELPLTFELVGDGTKTLTAAKLHWRFRLLKQPQKLQR